MTNSNVTVLSVASTRYDAARVLRKAWTTCSGTDITPVSLVRADGPDGRRTFGGEFHVPVTPNLIPATQLSI
jgi:hypothetical protein